MMCSEFKCARHSRIGVFELTAVVVLDSSGCLFADQDVIEGSIGVGVNSSAEIRMRQSGVPESLLQQQLESIGIDVGLPEVDHQRVVLFEGCGEVTQEQRGRRRQAALPLGPLLGTRP
jgi:hypothetical protein